MKTIKQLREEYDTKVLNQANSPDRLMLEGRSSVVKSANKTRAIPLPEQMPAMLLFRRVAYRLYPGKQVVALYYSKTVDKYLSVPFGPDGNLNLSESTMYNTYEEVEIAEGKMLDAVKTVAGSTASGAAKGIAMGLPGHLPGMTAGAVVGGTVGAAKGIRRVLDKPKVNERFHERLSTIREENLDENVLKSLGGWALNKAIDYFTGDKEKDKEKEKSKDSVMDKTNSDYIRQKPGAKGHSSWKQAGDTSQSYQSRLKAATQKDIDTIRQSRQVAENKISHIRKMVNEGTDRLDMEINGRTVHINTTMAKRILEVYDSVNTKNKKIVESMLNEDLESFKKLLNFSIKV